MELLRSQIAYLLDNEMFRSAEILGGMLLSPSTHFSPPSEAMHLNSLRARAENMVMFADALFGVKEYKRALKYYRQAQTLLHFHSDEDSATQKDKDLSELRIKAARCCTELHMLADALTELEAIEKPARTLKVHFTMARLYREFGNNTAAIAAYQDCLRMSPYALEVVQALTEIGCPPKDVMELLPKSQSQVLGKPASGSKQQPMARDVEGCIHLFARGYEALETADYGAAAVHFSSLTALLPGSLHALICAAQALAGKGDSAAAAGLFARSRMLDPLNARGMDTYASLLRDRGDRDSLARLWVDLKGTIGSRPETSMAASAYYESCGELEKAGQYVCEGLGLDSDHRLLRIQRGHLLLRSRDVAGAVENFSLALGRPVHMAAYDGLVLAHLEQKRPKKALKVAQAAMRAAPYSAHALVLMGRVKAAAICSEEAQEWFQKAIRLDPRCLEASLLLADIHRTEGRPEAAIEVLKQQTLTGSSEKLQVRLAHAYRERGQGAAPSEIDEPCLKLALLLYQGVLSQNPQCFEAQQGIQALQRVLSAGQSPGPKARILDHIHNHDIPIKPDIPPCWSVIFRPPAATAALHADATAQLHHATAMAPTVPWVAPAATAGVPPGYTVFAAAPPAGPVTTTAAAPPTPPAANTMVIPPGLHMQDEAVAASMRELGREGAARLAAVAAASSGADAPVVAAPGSGAANGTAAIAAAAPSDRGVQDVSAAPGSGAATGTAAEAAATPSNTGDQEVNAAPVNGAATGTEAVAVAVVLPSDRGDQEVSAAPGNSPGSTTPDAVVRRSRGGRPANPGVRRRLRSRRSWRDLPPPTPLS